ncbi:serine hydrolase domain-containing protein [Microbacterium terregens]|uniref:Serine hydrolase domain-containing protein n=1 Tax=Microbacterium terregens TaxID=69363 RepID=A0ABV5T122_9MICO
MNASSATAAPPLGAHIERLDDVLAATVASQDAPFVVAAVADTGGLRWSGTAGQDGTGEDVRLDAVFRIYSQTKAIGATALLILVDRGLVSLDTPVAQLLPDFAGVHLLDSIGLSGPVLRAPRTECTVRHLLTHTSGLAYEGLDARMTAYRGATGDPVTGILSLQTLLSYPFVFEPGSAFAYGVGVDWVGQLVERLDGRRIDRFCAEEIFDPLGMTDTVFEPSDRPGRIPAVRQRTPSGGFRVVDVAPPEHPAIYGLGTCLYGTALDYLRFLRMVLGGGELDGRRILSDAAVELLRTDQMPAGLSVSPITSDDHSWSCDIHPFPEVRKTWTAGFLRVEADVPGMRSAGTLSWGGILNTHYWVDPANNVAAVFMTQALPFVEPRFMDRYAQFERAVYRDLVADGEEDER